LTFAEFFAILHTKDEGKHQQTRKDLNMAKVSKPVVDKALRDKVFTMLLYDDTASAEFKKINDRQYGVLLTDANGEQRYVRIGAIVAELREDMTAEQLMQAEIDAYNQKQADKAEKAKAKEAKIAEDKAKREAKAKEQEENADVE
jgi:DNA-directed RNA polymerase delta subunit